jgi:preprotein translocase subunit SecD
MAMNRFLACLLIILVLVTACGSLADEQASETRIAAKISATQTASAPTITPQPTLICPTPSVATHSGTTHVYQTILTGRHLSSVRLEATQTTGEPYVSFSMTQNGTDILADFTRKHVGGYLVITINKIVIASPIIKSPILEGSGIIEGGFTLQEARELKSLIESCPNVLEFIDSGDTDLPIGEIVQTTGL